MTIEQAIEKAIEGGWDTEGDVKRVNHPTYIVCDPAFWQSLGKAMGWDDKSKIKDYWKFNWHSLIDHLADGGSIESYFEKL